MSDPARIQPYGRNPCYWQHRDRPVLLLGGSVEDNLFQVREVEPHLDELVECGGNYVRCTMSSRDPGDVWPFTQDPLGGMYDLRHPSGEYWNRFSNFLRLCDERGIIVQVEMFDRFDFANDPWLANPFNPRNNCNYDPEGSGLATRYDAHPGSCQNDFFHSVPLLQNNALLLEFQRSFVDTLLELSLPFGNVLYCIDNETNDDPQWGWYWARHVLQRARERGVEAHLTEMWDSWDLEGSQHAQVFDHAELFDFLEVSQNNHQEGEIHYRKLLHLRDRILASGRRRPMNSVKVYGAHTSHHGTSRNAQESFWRNLFAGVAAVRFHRPPAGHGLDEVAKAHLRAARLLCKRFDPSTATPANHLLLERSRNEAFCLAGADGRLAAFFTDGGQVQLASDADRTLHWLDVTANRWLDETVARSEDGLVGVATPEPTGYWVLLVDPPGADT